MNPREQKGYEFCKTDTPTNTEASLKAQNQPSKEHLAAMSALEEQIINKNKAQPKQ